MYGLVAALFTRMSTRPSRSTVAATQAPICSGSPALAAKTSSLPPAVPISSAVASRASILRDDSITSAPAAANVAATALPIPRLAPVTRATFPSSVISMPGN
jgi:hypothetical protein